MSTQRQSKRMSLLTANKATLEKEEAVHQESQDKLQVESDILATKLSVSTCKKELFQLKSASILSPVSIVGKQTELESYEAGLSALKNLKTELF